MMVGPSRNFGASFLSMVLVLGGVLLVFFDNILLSVVVNNTSDTVTIQKRQQQSQSQQEDKVNYTDNIAPSSSFDGEQQRISGVPLVNNSSSAGTRVVGAGQEQIAVLHVGPHKTGTTYLQMELLRLEMLLRKDGYALPAIKGEFKRHKAVANLAFSLQGDFSHVNAATWPHFMDFMDKTKQDGMSVILSSEEFDKGTVDIENLSLIFKHWDQTRVVLAYRRVYEWLKSLNFQVNRKSKNPQSFVDWLRGMNLTSTWRHELQGSHVRDRYRAHFNNIFITNYHNHNKSLTESFFCDAVPHAVQTCQSVRQPAPPAMANKGFSLEYRRLASAAKQKGLIGPKVDLNKATDQVQEFHEVRQNKKLQDLPQYCLEDDLVEVLFQISLTEEKTMVPGWFENEGGEVALREAFRAFQDSGALCAVDVDKVLDDEAWKLFFKGFI